VTATGSFKFVHAADVHLDSPLHGLTRYVGAPVPEVRAATRRALTGLVDLAIEEEASFVVIAGDLFDGASRDYNTALFFCAEASRLHQAEIPLLVALGNHDAASLLTKQLHVPPNTTVFRATRPQSVMLENVPVVVHGQSFQRRETPENLAQAFPLRHEGLFNVGVLHTSIDGREGQAGYAPCSVDDLVSKGYDYFALGHVHRRVIVSSDPWVVFPGCTQGRNLREPGANGVTLVTVEDNLVSAVEHRDVDVVRWISITICSPLDEETLLAEVSERLRHELDAGDGRLVAARLLVEGETPLHRTLVSERERITNELRAAATDVAPGEIWLEKVRVETQAPVDLSLLAARDDALGGLYRFLRDTQRDPEALSQLADELSDLQRKLPPDLEDWFELTEPENLVRLVADAEQLLLPRLVGGEVG
jgi:DNA repair protein SbcD/Mre11